MKRKIIGWVNLYYNRRKFYYGNIYISKDNAREFGGISSRGLFPVYVDLPKKARKIKSSHNYNEDEHDR